MAKLSVVVPIFNVEGFLEEALESIARQTMRDLEVIVVDDGSTDGSAVIAKSFAAHDPRFRLLQQQNQGPGPARNEGVRSAAGKYLAFVDGDDLLDSQAYEVLVGSLDRSGSDIACGGVRRLRPGGAGPSQLHEEPFRETLRRTHVCRQPALLQDRTVWNKVFRRSFWDSRGLTFAAGLYEDVPVALRAHVLASSVDVFRDVVYCWRARQAGALSTTQRATELSNIEHRMRAVGDVGAFLAATAPQLKPVYDRSVLNSDLVILMRAYELAGEAERERLAELAARYLRTVDESGYEQVSAARRLNYCLLRNHKTAELLDVLRYWRRGGGVETPVVRSGGSRPRWYACYPFFRDAALGIPDEVYDVTAEMTLTAGLDAVSWRAGRLRIEGFAYIRRLSSASAAECQIRVMLRNSRLRRTIRLPVQRICRPDVTARSEQAVACYDWSGFAVEVNPRRLSTLGAIWRASSWELRIEVSGGGLRREGPINTVAAGSPQWPEGRWVTGNVWVQPAAEHDGRFFIRGRPVRASVTSCQVSGDAIQIEGWTMAQLSSGATVVISPRKGGTAPIRVAADRPPGPVGRRRGSGGRARFRALIPAASLVHTAMGVSAIDRGIPVHDEIIWDVSLAPGDGSAAVRLAIAPGVAGACVHDGGGDVTAFASRFGYLSMLKRTRRPVVTHVRWTGDQRLILRGDYPDPLPPEELLLRHSESGDTHVVPLAWQNGKFTAEFAPGSMPGMAGQLPLASGNWNLLARFGNRNQVAVTVARVLLPSLPGYHGTGTHEAELRPYRTDALRLRVRTAIGDDERGRYALRRLAGHDYPRALARPLRELAVFDSFSGQHYSCNPRAIHARLRQVRPDLDCAWVSRDGQFSVPDGARVVLAGSRDHFEALARARYVIFNDSLPAWFRKRGGQFCLQTWHGTPLKCIGLDIARPQFPTGLIYPDVLRNEVASWDVLLSPNRFSTPIFRRAFDFPGEIMESGYPRNDLLHDAAGQQQRIAGIRKRLGLPPGKRVVLYAPTWRDDSFLDGRYRFDVQLDLEAAGRALGGDHILLLRLHTKVRGSPPGRPQGRGVLDVSRYPDIADLYLISDVLITDYSSAMFDFAGTGRPMLFFTYDLERYRDQLRGFYFDFEAQAPGPLLRTSDEVVGALRDIDQTARSYQPAYEAFSAKFCALDDGGAAGRVVDRLLTGP